MLILLCIDIEQQILCVSFNCPQQICTPSFLLLSLTGAATVEPCCPVLDLLSSVLCKLVGVPALGVEQMCIFVGKRRLGFEQNCQCSTQKRRCGYEVKAHKSWPNTLRNTPLFVSARGCRVTQGIASHSTSQPAVQSARTASIAT